MAATNTFSPVSRFETSRAYTIAESFQKNYENTSFFRSVIDSICNFFTGHPTEATIEKLAIKKEINNAIITAIKQSTTQPDCFKVRDSIDITIQGQKINIQNDINGGVSVYFNNNSEKIITQSGLKVQDLINDAVMTNGGGDINTGSVHARIGECSINEIEKISLKKYQENGFLYLKEPSDDIIYHFDLLGSVNDNIHLCKEKSIEGSESILPALSKMREQINAIKIKNNSENDHVMLIILGINKMKTWLPRDSDHYVFAAVSSNSLYDPVIVDSKNSALYPNGINIQRSGHQSFTDTVSCGAHALRAMNSFAIQLTSGKSFPELTLPPAFKKEICEVSLDVELITLDLVQKRMEEEKKIDTTFASDSILSYDTFNSTL